MYLGIDPGIRKLWYALVDTQMQVIDAGILLLDQEAPTRADQFKRMEQIFKFFVKLVRTHPIQAVGMEKLYFTSYNQSNAEFVYGIRGALAMLFCQKKIPLYEWTPLQLKKAITGSGKAGKELMVNVITKLYQLETAPERHDAADALGLCRMVKGKMSQWWHKK